MIVVSKRKKMIKKLLTGALAGLLSMGAFAWQPTKPVTVIIAYGPGSGNEILIRKLDSIITRTNKINFVLEFKPGAFELIGMNHFAKAANDGHVLYAPGVGVYYGTPVWFKKSLVQDPSEWEPVISLGETPLAVFTSADNAVNHPRELFNLMKSGQKINIGVGAPVFVLAHEHMVKTTGAKQAQRVQYNSPAAVAQAAASKEVEFGLAPLGVVTELANAGRLKIIGVTGSAPGRHHSLSDQFKGLDLVGHVGLMLPKGTAKPVVDYYKKVFAAAIATPEYQSFLAGINFYDSLKTPEAYKVFIDSQRRRWIPVAETIEFQQ